MHMANFLRWLAALIEGCPRRPNEYRIVRVRGGFEPQMSYTAGWDGHLFWTPLSTTGYWADPHSFGFGKVTKRPAPMSRSQAESAITRARMVNAGGRVIADVSDPAIRAIEPPPVTTGE